MAGLILEPHLSKSGKSFVFYSCTSDVIVISRNSQWGESCKKPLKPSSPGIQRFLIKCIYEQHVLSILFGYFIGFVLFTNNSAVLAKISQLSSNFYKELLELTLKILKLITHEKWQGYR